MLSFFKSMFKQENIARQSSLITAEQLKSLMDKKPSNLRIIDTTIPTPWGGPQNSKESYEKERIGNASYLSVDELKDHSSSLPHMMPNNEDFRKYLKESRIKADTDIIVYDQHGMFSAPRVWFMFRVFGLTNVRVLEGGLPLWKNLDMPLNSGTPLKQGDDQPEEQVKFQKDESQVIDMDGLNAIAEQNLNTPFDKWNSIIIDNRSAPRYRAEVEEPRKNCRSGCVPSALNLPFTEVLDDKQCFKSEEEIQKLFTELKIDIEKELIWYCGSGLTACIPLLAAHIIGAKKQKIYDGAWTEYGSHPPPSFSQK